MSVDFIKQKAREISYSLIRICFYVKRTDLRVSIEGSAFELLENSARLSADNNPENLNKALASVSVLDSLIRLGHSIYEIEPVNATILVRELDGLNSAIRQFGNYPYGNEELPNVESFFSKVPATIESQPQVQVQEEMQPMSADRIKLTDFSSDTPQPLKISLTEDNNGSGNSAINVAIRQSAIINKIKENNSCRLKDLITGFPDVSERTLRYDLQRLCGQGVIERVGNGGPASYYRIMSRN